MNKRKYHKRSANILIDVFWNAIFHSQQSLPEALHAHSFPIHPWFSFLLLLEAVFS